MHYNQEVLVAVQCITYNHENYIRECLEGFIMQKTNFKFVAIVHDDASTDNTASIIREYAEKYPNIIKPIFESENQYSKGNLSNVMRNAVFSTGAKFVANCEGDDFWTDPLKLQKQVDYMERHPDCSMLAHKTYLVDADTKEILSIKSVDDYKDNYTIEDAIRGFGRIMCTCSYIHKKEVYEYMPNFARVSPCGDYILPILASRFGYIGFIPEVLSAHRVGVKGSITTNWKGNYSKREEYNLQYDKMLKALDKDTDYKYSGLIKQESNALWFRTYLEYGMYDYLKNEPYRSLYVSLPLQLKIKHYIKNKCPSFYSILQKVKKYVNNHILHKYRISDINK